MLKRAVEDTKYQNEEYLRQIHMKNQEISSQQTDIAQLRHMLEKSDEDSDNFKAIITELEEKNRKLNDKLNEVIFNKAAAYKQRTIQAL